jgi:Pycsar effector protein
MSTPENEEFSHEPPGGELDPYHFIPGAPPIHEWRPGGAIPNQPALFSSVDSAAALAFRTPLREYVPAADTKATAMLTGLGLMFTLLARYDLPIGKLLAEETWKMWVFVTLLVVFSALAILAILRCFQTIFPRFPKAPPSLAFFADIARLTREEYIESVGRLTHQQAIDQMLQYNHTLASICVVKYAVLARAVFDFKASLAIWVGLMLILSANYLNADAESDLPEPSHVQRSSD